VQLLYSAFRLFDRQHLNEGEALRRWLCFRSRPRVLHCSDAIEQFKEIALRRIEGQIPDISGDW